jgi:beta-phosphoglucomutase
MKIKACIFDLDGVICDTAKYHYLAWKELADGLNFEFTAEHNELLKGVSRVQSLEILLGIGKIKATEEQKHEMAQLKNERYKTYVEKMQPNEILPGVLPFLKELRQNKIKIALGSASKNAKSILERLNITDLFDAIVDGTMVSEAKPNPEVFLKGALLLGVKPQETVVFEDAQAGIEAALNGKMIAFGIGKPEVLNQAYKVINGFKDYSLENLLSDLKNVN